MTRKTCIGCRRRLAADSFHRCRAASDGLQSRCKTCRKQWSTTRVIDYSNAGGKKRCGTCRRVKPLATGFYKNKSNSDGYYGNCKTCHKATVKAWATRNHESFTAYAREWRAGNRDKSAAAARRYRLRKKYGLTEAQLASMCAAQDGKCTLCRKKKRLVVDHCHRTGVVRGLLCGSCNTGLGSLCDDVGVLERAIAYLGSTQPQVVVQ